jgi:hypothetical protein
MRTLLVLGPLATVEKEDGRPYNFASISDGVLNVLFELRGILASRKEYVEYPLACDAIQKRPVSV